MTQEYEDLTVPELKDLAAQRGVEIPSDARKLDIIEALEKQDKEFGVTTEATAGKAEGKNVYEYQMSSTVEALCNSDDFWRLKLVS